MKPLRVLCILISVTIAHIMHKLHHYLHNILHGVAFIIIIYYYYCYLLFYIIGRFIYWFLKLPCCVFVTFYKIENNSIFHELAELFICKVYWGNWVCQYLVFVRTLEI